MLPDDVFRSRLQTTITALRYWAPSIADAARMQESETGNFWKIIVTPMVASACPFELILHFDQRYDLAVGDETYERRPIESFDWFVPFAEAIAERQRRAAALDQPPDGPGAHRWKRSSSCRAATSGAKGAGCRPHHADRSTTTATELRERRFLPYRR